MKQFIFFICLFLFASCQPPLSKEKTETKLIERMSAYLNNDSITKGKIDFSIQSVAYFEEKDVYLCEFKVRMLSSKSNKLSGISFDTTGIMKAKINKDFTSVKRIN